MVEPGGQQLFCALTRSFEHQKVLEQWNAYLKQQKDAETKRATALASTLKLCKTQAQDLGQRVRNAERDLQAAVEYSETRDAVCEEAHRLLDAQPEILAGYRKRATHEEAAAESLSTFLASCQKYLDEMHRHPVEKDREHAQQREAEMRQILGQAVKGSAVRPSRPELGDSTAPVGTVTSNVLDAVENTLRTLRLQRETQLLPNLPEQYAETIERLNMPVRGMSTVGACEHLGRVSAEMAVLLADLEIQRPPDSEDAGQRRDVGQEEESGERPHPEEHLMEMDENLAREARETDLPEDDCEVDDEVYYEVQE